MSVHAVGVLLEKIYLFIYKFADNNQKMKGKKEMKGKRKRERSPNKL